MNNRMEMGDNERGYAVALSRTDIIGPRAFHQLRAVFGSLERAWRAPLNALRDAGLGERVASELCDRRARIDPVDERAFVARCGIRVAVSDDDDYPPLLKETYAAPYVLFYRGNLPAGSDHCVSVVGTRRPSAYGRQATHQLVGEIAGAPCAIVSGLAFGVDGCAHERTLEVGGITHAVLGTGVDDRSIYPPEHRHLAGRIIDAGGCVMSEYPPHTRGNKHRFPQRNRIIAGLSRATIVIEAPERSGALITAEFALHENREVFAVPGPITSPLSVGANGLLKRGAHVCASVRDLAEIFDFIQLRNERSASSQLSDDERLLVGVLGDVPLHIDEVALRASLDIQGTASTLLILEMKGLVKNLGSMKYIRLM